MKPEPGLWVIRLWIVLARKPYYLAWQWSQQIRHRKNSEYAQGKTQWIWSEHPALLDLSSPSSLWLFTHCSSCSLVPLGQWERPHYHCSNLAGSAQLEPPFISQVNANMQKLRHVLLRLMVFLKNPALCQCTFLACIVKVVGPVSPGVRIVWNFGWISIFFSPRL